MLYRENSIWMMKMNCYTFLEFIMLESIQPNLTLLITKWKFPLEMNDI